MVGGDFEDLTDPSKLTDEQIATVVLNRSRVEKWMKAVWSHAIERHRLGDAVEGVKVVEGRGSRRWTEEGKEALVELVGDQAYEKKLIGVTAAGCPSRQGHGRRNDPKGRSAHCGWSG